MALIDVRNFDDALTFIQQNPSLTAPELTQLFSQMGVKVEGSTSTLLYSGQIGSTGQGALAWQIAENLGADSGGAVATIGQTDAGKLAGSQIFRDALRDAFGGTNNPNAQTQVKILLEGTTAPDGTRITPGLFDQMSDRFVSEAVGPVKTITPTATIDGVFTQTEIKSLLANPDITHIDGVPKQFYADAFSSAKAAGLSDADAYIQVQEIVRVKSAHAATSLQIVLDGNGNVTQVGADARFWGDTPGVTHTTLPPDTPGLTSGAALLRDISPSSLEGLVHGGKYILSQAGVVGDLIGTPTQQLHVAA